MLEYLNRNLHKLPTMYGRLYYIVMMYYCVCCNLHTSPNIVTYVQCALIRIVGSLLLNQCDFYPYVQP